MEFDVNLAWSLLPQLLQATGVTLAVVALPLVLGMLISLPITLARLSDKWILVTAAWTFTTVCRGAPALVMIYMVYNGAATLGFIRDSFLWDIFSQAYYCAVIGLTLNHAGFLTEVLRGAIQAVPKELIEAGQSLALSRRRIFLKITMPMALRYGLSAYLNEVILFTKGTAIVGAITVTDVMAVANEAVSTTFDPVTPLVMAALIYWSLVQGLRNIFTRLEAHLNQYLALDDHPKTEIGTSV